MVTALTEKPQQTPQLITADTQLTSHKIPQEESYNIKYMERMIEF